MRIRENAEELALIAREIGARVICGLVRHELEGEKTSEGSTIHRILQGKPTGGICASTKHS